MGSGYLPRASHPWLVCVAAISYGTITVGARYFTRLGFSWYEISFLIVLIPIPLLPFWIFRPELRIPRSQLRFFLVFGLIGAGLQLAQFSGIVTGVPVAVVALLLYTQPVWTVLLGRAVLGESLDTGKLLSLVLAISGTVFLLEPWQNGSGFSAYGIAGGVAAGMFLSLWVLWGKLGSLRRIHFLTSAIGYSGFSSFYLLALYPLLRQAGVDPQLTRLDIGRYAEHWEAVAIYTLLAGVLPVCLIFVGLRSLEASRAGLLMLLEPVSAALGAWLVFAEPLTRGIYAGGALILAANILQLGRRRGPSQPCRFPRRR